MRFGKISDRELVYDYLITGMECSYDCCPLEEAEIKKKKKRYSFDKDIRIVKGPVQSLRIRAKMSE